MIFLRLKFLVYFDEKDKLLLDFNDSLYHPSFSASLAYTVHPQIADRTPNLGYSFVFFS